MSDSLIDLTAPGVAGLHPYVPGKPVEELERELGISDSVKLASNENPLGPSPLALQAVQADIAELNLYPDDVGFRLRNALSDRFGVPVEQLILGRGSSEILDMVCRVFLSPGVNAVFSEHAFAMYPIFTQATGAQGKVVTPLPHDHPDMPYGHDLEGMLDAIDERTRVVFIANPNNPTGTWLMRGAIADFLARVPPRVVVVLDEAYCEYVTEPDYPNGLDWVPTHPNLLVTRTFSKIYGLAGLRCGWAAGGAELIGLLNRVRHPFHVGNLALSGAEAALRDEAHVARSVEVNSAGLGQLRGGLESLGLSALPSVGNFLCINVGRPGREVFDGLLRQGVISRPVDNYGLPGFVRLTVGTESQNERALQALAQVVGA